jgi:Protein of unknown function (DUF3617)
LRNPPNIGSKQENFVRVILPLSALFLSLVACGPAADIPENIPVMGKWRDETRLMSIQYNGAAMDRAKLPGLPEDKAAEVCMEPKMRNEEEMRELLGQNPMLSSCAIGGVTRNGPRTSFSGSCASIPIAQSAGMEGSASIKANAFEAPNKATLNFTIEAVVRQQDGNGAMIRMDAQRTLTRLGDC